MVGCKECRAHVRHEATGKVRIVWDEAGIQRQSTGEIRNVSVDGLACWLGQRIPARTEVRVECPSEHLLGTAIVRHCNGKGMRFLVGVEFRGTLKWRAPGEQPRARGWD
jgi:hypothetical protein